MSTTVSAINPVALSKRLDRAAAAAASAGVAALLMAPGSDLRYLLGAGGSSFERLTCFVVPADGSPTLVVPKLEAPGYDPVPLSDLGVQVATWVDGEDPYGLVAALVGNPAKVAVGDVMVAMHVLGLRAALPDAEQVLAGPIVRELRMRKDAEEIAELRAAGAAIDRVHARMGEFLQVGRTESEVGADIEAAIVAEGHAVAEFVIVGSGPNGASPHHRVSDRVIEAGDVVVIDIGGPVPSGYCSDSTRTYVMGEPRDTDVLKTYAVLQEAQQAAVDAVRPGIPAQDIDAAARDVIASAGFGEYFIHRTGHGIGLTTHEPPYMVEGETRRMAPGMCFSIEPGVYLPGRFGVRIEDIVTVTESAGRRLNNTSHELYVVA